MAKPNFQSFLASVSDISSHGLGLLTNSALPPGTVIAIELRSVDPHRSSIRLAVVRHATPVVGRTWLLGCRMEESLCDSELWQLIGDDEAFPLQPSVHGETPTDEIDGDFSGKSGTGREINGDREL